jgi:hypothetical protein
MRDVSPASLGCTALFLMRFGLRTPTRTRGTPRPFAAPPTLAAAWLLQEPALLVVADRLDVDARVARELADRAAIRVHARSVGP